MSGVGEDLVAQVESLTKQLEATNLAHKELLDSRDAKIAELTWKITHDPLTDILNRAGFMGAIEGYGLASEMLTVGIIDLDSFKDINDTNGHDRGDTILIEFAGELAQMATPIGGSVARLGGDEFGIAIPGVHPEIGTLSLLSVQTCSFSVGVAVGPSNPENWPKLLKSADIAMYFAKRVTGKSCCLGNNTPESATPSNTRRWRSREGHIQGL